VCTYKTPTKHDRFENIGIININEYPLNPDILFVPITNMFSTAVMVCGFDAHNMPINTNSKHITVLNRPYLSELTPNNVSTLCLIDLHPERRKIEFDITAYNNNEYNNNLQDID
jgi:hypothetical protein